MRNILFPTDFSGASETAQQYALELANLFGAQLSVLHTYKVYSTASMLVSVEDRIKDEAKRQLLTTIRQIEPQLRNGATVNSRLVYGDAVPTIATLGDKEYQLIVMGSQGSSNVREVFSGSVANGVIRQARCPVLVVPAHYQYRPLKNIVLAVDSKPLRRQQVAEVLAPLAHGTGATVRVFHQVDDHDSDTILPATAEAQLRGVSHSVHYDLVIDDINDSIDTFVREQQAELLCMIHRERNFLASLFHSSTTKREIFDIDVPLLILHDQV